MARRGGSRREGSIPMSITVWWGAEAGGGVEARPGAGRGGRPGQAKREGMVTVVGPELGMEAVGQVSLGEGWGESVTTWRSKVGE